MPPLLADFIYSSDCKLICEKSLTLPLIYFILIIGYVKKRNNQHEMHIAFISAI